MISQADTSVYTDFNSLSRLKLEASQDKEAALKKVAEQFEQIFMDMMLKSMREANESFVDEDSPFNSNNVQFYQSMFDQQLTTDLASKGGMGLADIIVKQLGGGAQEKARLEKALEMPGAEKELRMSLEQGTTVRETVMDLASRRVAVDSLAKVDEVLGIKNSNVSPEMALSAAPSVEAPAPIKTPSKMRFESPEGFVSAMLPMAQKAAERLGVDPKVLVAQAALETGWGKHINTDSKGNTSFNLFNIKATGGWKGRTAEVLTTEYREGVAMRERAEFRAYNNFEESFMDYVRLIENSPRYEEARKSADSPIEYLKELQKAGYATDPKYAEKINRIYNGQAMNQLKVDLYNV